MQWEHMTATEFAKAVKKTGVCVVAIGVLERHSEHLPLGTDYLNGHKIACLATEKEPAIVFPPFYWGQIYEGRCFPGTLMMKPTLLLELFEGVFDEIARNGIKKILLYTAHGGNWQLVRFLAQCWLWQEKPYTLYVVDRWLTSEREKKWQEILQTKEHAHACECETSVSLANHPELVRMDRIPKEAATARGRAKTLDGLYTGLSWYADYPEHYAGDARSASPEKGLALRQLQVETLAEYIRAVKKDEVMPALAKEFFGRERKLRGK